MKAWLLDLEVGKSFKFTWDYFFLFFVYIQIGDNGVISFDEEVSEESDLARYRNLPYYYDVVSRSSTIIHVY